MRKAIDYLWEFTGEFFIPVEYENKSAEEGFGPAVHLLKDKWMQKVREVFEEATLPMPGDSYMQTGGKTGTHTEFMGFTLAEMQSLQELIRACGNHSNIKHRF
jgi:ring-1,2-phenylacetyl-CoA epoxidase subunit PaaC